MAVNKNQMKEMAKEQVANMFAELLENAEKVDNYEYAIPVIVEGVEIVVTATLVAKNWYDTKQAKAYNLAEKIEEYEDDKAYKEKIAKQKAEDKAKKLAKKSK